MKTSRLIPFIVFMLCMVFILPTADAQKKRKKKKKSEDNNEYFEDKAELKDKLWYGAGLGLGFGRSTFNFSFSPMVGYKIFDRLSVGPRIPIDYIYIKSEVVNKDTGVPLGQKGFSKTDIGIGLFTRFKVMDQFFLHGEYAYSWGKDFIVQRSSNRVLWDEEKNKVYTESDNSDSAALGIGYTGGQIIDYEVSVLYDFLHKDDDQGLPFEIRIGFNYNF